jgi:altronate dehydratase large subunit
VARAAGEHDFESTARAWGDQPVRSVLAYGERATHEAGLAVVDAPSRFEEAATALAAAGAQVVVHVTGEGVPTGHPVVPVCKVSADPGTLAAVGDDVDVDARTASAADLLETVTAVADGDRTRAEAHGLASMAITRVGPSM